MYRSYLFLMAALMGTNVAISPQMVGAQSLTAKNPNASEYFTSAVSKNENGDYEGALADYNQAILLNPKSFTAYYNRALLKIGRFYDAQGAMLDYNQAIALNPRFAEAYSDRGLIKDTKLNDVQGGLADYNQAITINPKYSIAYYNRANLRYFKLKDRAGAIQDLRQAARLFREQGNTEYLQYSLGALQSLGIDE
jgi:tetratricopeptide (TPR) repeat protein